jgi:UDP-glucose 4-epimerase
MSVNFTGTLNVMEAARKNDIDTVVLASSARVYGDPKILPVGEDYPTHPKEPYGASKAAAELIVQLYHQLYGIGTVILRPFSIYGPQRVRKQGTLTGVIPIFVESALLDQNLTIVGDGKQTKDFTHISDLVTAFKRCATEKAAIGRTFNIGTGIGTSVKDLAKAVLQVCSASKSRIAFIPSAAESVSNYADIHRAKEFLEWEPRVNLREGLIEYVDWYREYLKGRFRGTTE